MESHMHVGSLMIKEQTLVICDGDWEYNIHVNNTCHPTTFSARRCNFGSDYAAEVKKTDRVKEKGEGYVLDFFCYGRALARGYEDETCTLVDDKFQFIYYTKF
jgi:hypothetical protein